MDEPARTEKSPPPSRRARAGWEYAIAAAVGLVVFAVVFWPEKDSTAAAAAGGHYRRVRATRRGRPGGDEQR
jgi:hypothetical protein